MKSRTNKTLIVLLCLLCGGAFLLYLNGKKDWGKGAQSEEKRSEQARSNVESSTLLPDVRNVAKYEWRNCGSRDASLAEMPHEDGEIILQALTPFEKIPEWAPDTSMNGHLILVEPPPMLYQLCLTDTKGATFTLSFSAEAGLVMCSGEDLYRDLPDDAAKAIWARIEVVRERANRELRTRPKPFTYVMCSADDGGTLSGVARLVYGDGGKWTHIYEANKDKIKNPNTVTPGMKLTIPEVKPR